MAPSSGSAAVELVECDADAEDPLEECAPSEGVVELAGLQGATQLEVVSRRVSWRGAACGVVVAHVFVALKGRRAEARDVCRICLGSGRVRPAADGDDDDDDEGSDEL